MQLPIEVIRAPERTAAMIATAYVVWDSIPIEVKDPATGEWVSNPDPVCKLSAAAIAKAANLTRRQVEDALLLLGPKHLGFIQRRRAPHNINVWQTVPKVFPVGGAQFKRYTATDAAASTAAPSPAVDGSRVPPLTGVDPREGRESTHAGDGTKNGSSNGLLNGSSNTTTPTPPKNTSKPKRSAAPKATEVGGDLSSKPSRAKSTAGKYKAEHVQAILEITLTAQRRKWHVGSQVELDHLDHLLRQWSGTMIATGLVKADSEHDPAGASRMKRFIAQEISAEKKVSNLSTYITAIVRRYSGLEGGEANGEPTSAAIEGGEGRSSGDGSRALRVAHSATEEAA